MIILVKSENREAGKIIAGKNILAFALKEYQESEKLSIVEPDEKTTIEVIEYHI